jgi:hypothetical protein
LLFTIKDLLRSPFVFVYTYHDFITMAPKKNNNNNDTNASSSQKTTSSDTGRSNSNNNKNKNGNSQRIGGDGPRSKPVARSKRAVSRIDS